MAILKQSTAYTRMFLMVDSTDHVTGKTGLTVTVTLSKAGAAFAAAGGSITEVSSGWYKLALNTTDTNTLGDLAYHCTSTGADPTDFVDQVSASLLDDIDTLLATVAGYVDTEVAAIKAKTDNLPATPAATGDAMALTSAERNSVADALLNRDMSTGTDSGSSTVRTVRQALRFIRNKWAVSGTTLTVYKEDDATSSWTGTLTTSSSALPVTANDPAGP